jgi:hypothetical protein
MSMVVVVVDECINSTDIKLRLTLPRRKRTPGKANFAASNVFHTSLFSRDTEFNPAMFNPVVKTILRRIFLAAKTTPYHDSGH